MGRFSDMEDYQMTILEAETAYYEKKRKELKRTKPGRFLLIHGKRLHGDYSTVEKAVAAGTRKFGQGPFLVVKSGEPAQLEFFVPTIAYGAPIRCA